MRIWKVWVCVMTAAVLSVMGAGSTLESADLAWLLVQESPSSQPQQGAQLSVRRITPKSVFLAPTFTSCSEGYRQDALGRCVKVVKLNPSAQWDFFLQKLNSMYGPPEPNSKSNPGPFRLPIPLATELPAATTTTTTTELPTSSTVTEQPSVSTTVLTTTAPEEQTTDPPFLIVVANTTDQVSTVTEQTSTPSSTITNEPTSDTTTICNDCDTTITITTPSSSIQPSRTTIVFPEDHNRKRTSSPFVRFPESQSQQSPYWWPHSWEHRLWQPPSSAGYYQPRQSVYHGHREARPAWQH